jgi:pyruvate, orthophosphate dikinase
MRADNREFLLATIDYRWQRAKPRATTLCEEPEHRYMGYIYHFDDPPEVGTEESLHLLGGKGHNLSLMRREMGLPVPPGFTITTETGRVYLGDGWPSGLDDELRGQIARLEDEVGRRFGGPGEPLLVSVRSGAAVSMPGMMDTILNLGITEGNVAALAEACGDPVFARDSLSRFQKMYGTIVGDDAIPEDPWVQLRHAIEAVFRSWDTDRARSYRQREGIPDHLGTAVTVQAMVFGNFDELSGTGVLFTRNPATGERAPYGDFLFRAQGEDVVNGTHQTESIDHLEERLPDVAAELARHAATLETHFRDVCDIEFTVERARLWLLQVRVGKRSPLAALRFAIDMAEEPDFPLTRAEAVRRVTRHLANPPVTMASVGATARPIARGLPASPGLASGRIATTADTAVSMAESGADVVLVRPETSPDDVHGMARVRGILTSRGGLASHAAVVARGWGVPAVVGAEDVTVRDGTITISGHVFAEGEVITIDGQSGEIFAGALDVETIVSLEAQTLLGWAAELGIELRTEDEGVSPPVNEPGTGEVSEESVIQALHIKGFATSEALASVLMTAEATVVPVLEKLFDNGHLKMLGEMYSLSEEGRAIGVKLHASDREAWTEASADLALDGFLPLDARMKDIVTAWQMRQVDGDQVLNDHSDEQYDREVLGQLIDLHDEARTWLEPLSGGLPRLQLYLRRLDRAADRVASGEHAYIASPRIDSYHNVWFELHEDLIQLAGRTREEETEAGRA